MKCGAGQSKARLKYQIVRFLAALFSVALFSGHVFAEKRTEISSDPFLVLAEEKALAENNVFLLNEFGEKGSDLFAEGIQRYGIARSKFNGVIEWMKNRLTRGESIEPSPAFDKVLKMKTAVEKRVAFTHFINQKIIGDRKAERGILKSLIGDPAELISVLQELGRTLWQESRTVQDQGRKELIDHLEALKWGGFKLTP